MSTLKSIIPFLHILRNLTSEERVIVLSHLNDQTKDSIYKVISLVLRNKKVPFSDRLKLKVKLEPYKKALRYVTNKKSIGGGGKQSATKTKQLFQIGGEPLGTIIDSAIPLMLDLFSA